MTTAAHAKDPSIGIKLIARGIDPVVDIVAVHGLKGDAFGTWTVKAGSRVGLTEDVFWLKDLLPQEVPNARILSYGYDSDPGKVFDSASTNMVHHHAATLVSELHYFRRRANERRRPILWVVHSLGGIVLKRVLIYSNSCNVTNNPDFRSIKVSTYGALFMGTPHMGADLAKWGKMVEALIRAVTPKAWVDSNNSLISALGKNSETLQNISEEFRSISRDFKLFFAWEELKTAIPGMSKDVIVEYSSAVPEALPDAGKAAIHATHSEMCKFSDEGSPGYNVVVGWLCDCTENAPQAVAYSWQQEDDRKQRDIEWQMRHTIMSQGYGRGRTPSPQRLDTSNQPQQFVGGTQRAGLLGENGEILFPYEISEYETTPPGSRGREHTDVVPSSPILFKPETLQENDYFEGREEELKEVHRILRDRKRRSVAISAVTGAGKTHLAREYFFGNKAQYPGGTFWIDCKPLGRASGDAFSTHSLDWQYSKIAEDLRLPPMIEQGESGERDAKDVFLRQVISWFKRTDDWLICFDGVDVEDDKQIDLVSKYVPKVKRGSIIFTTLNSALAGSVRLGSPQQLKLDRIEIQTGINMLLHYSMIRSPNQLERNAAQDLVKDLGYLPLAIHSAGSWMKRHSVTIADYRRSYVKRPYVEREFLEPFHIIFDCIADRHAEAHNLVRLLAFFNRDVPVDMLAWGIKELPRNINLVAYENGRHDFNNTIGHLLMYSLIERSPIPEGHTAEAISVDTLMLHSVAQDVAISRMRKSRGSLKEWLGYARDVLCGSFDLLDSRRARGEFLISDYQRYQLHGEHILGHSKKHKITVDRLEAVLKKVADAIEGDGMVSDSRRSMFRSGSMTDSSSNLETPTPTPGSSRAPSWEIYMTPAPAAVENGHANGAATKPSEPPQKAEGSGSNHSKSRTLREDAAKELQVEIQRQQKDKPFKFRYEPPKGPRNMMPRPAINRNQQRPRAPYPFYAYPQAHAIPTTQIYGGNTTPQFSTQSPRSGAEMLQAFIPRSYTAGAQPFHTRTPPPPGRSDTLPGYTSAPGFSPVPGLTSAPGFSSPVPGYASPPVSGFSSPGYASPISPPRSATSSVRPPSRGRSPGPRQHYNPRSQGQVPITSPWEPHPIRNNEYAQDTSSYPPNFPGHQHAYSAPAGFSFIPSVPSSPAMSTGSGMLSPANNFAPMNQYTRPGASRFPFPSQPALQMPYAPLSPAMPLPYPVTPGLGVRPPPFSPSYMPDSNLYYPPAGHTFTAMSRTASVWSEPILQHSNPPSWSPAGPPFPHPDSPAGAMMQRYMSQESNHSDTSVPRSATRSPSPYGVFRMDSARRSSTSLTSQTPRAQSGHSPRTPPHLVIPEHPEIAEAEEREYTHEPQTPFVDALENPISDVGLGISAKEQNDLSGRAPTPPSFNVPGIGMVPFGEQLPTEPSLTQAGRGQSPLRRFSVPESSDPEKLENMTVGGGESMVRSSSEPGLAASLDTGGKEKTE